MWVWVPAEESPSLGSSSCADSKHAIKSYSFFKWTVYNPLDHSSERNTVSSKHNQAQNSQSQAHLSIHISHNYSRLKHHLLHEGTHKQYALCGFRGGEKNLSNHKHRSDSLLRYNTQSHMFGEPINVPHQGTCINKLRKRAGRQGQGYKDIYWPMTFKCTQECILVTFHWHSDLTNRQNITISHV